ncbi:MAG TPA: PIN domain-containing protein [Solirubrobacteraceae bacterium]|nr:PIN domain-containing protein [Solirubrobacteraceae bacterium]
MIVLDTSAVLAFMDRRDANHDAVRDWMREQTQELITTPLVVAELDHLVARQGGPRATKALREDLNSGAYLVEWWPGAMRETIALATRHESMELGLTDASLLALAARMQTVSIATLDERRFRVCKPSAGGGAFTLLPADAP